jgi:hypothetical protein
LEDAGRDGGCAGGEQSLVEEKAAGDAMHGGSC